MTRRQRNAARCRKVAVSRGEAICVTYGYLATIAASDVTGATLIQPDGTTTYVSAEDARALHDKNKNGGRA